MVHLTEDETDALTELANMGVGRAAANLSTMVSEQVHLSVPRLEVISFESAAHLMNDRSRGNFVAVGQEFKGAFSGRALLIFPESNSLELVRAVVGREMSLEEVVDIEQEALTEIGNIILNGCLATMANVLQRGLTMSLPSVLRGGGARVLSTGQQIPAEQHVLFLYIDFALKERNVSGYLALVMDLPSLEALKQLLREFIARIAGGGAPA